MILGWVDSGHERSQISAHKSYLSSLPHQISQQQGVGGRVWGVGRTVLVEAWHLDQYNRLEKTRLVSLWWFDAQYPLHPTPHTLHPAPTGHGQISM
ncbi:hypothetical protein [Nostoc sp. PCC 7524]|uniref:hypothetical protein n=1 Tax=Nostoc sp. (strain ATCC 29411 / PCC 7524) TaxID=28072 RepID=UPI000A6EAAD2|nr:hypothetical protein [Nostoc sp. PCC 7524]